MSGPDTATLLPNATRAQALARTWRLLRRRPGESIMVVLSAVVVGLAGLVGPIMLGRLVDRLLADPAWPPVVITAAAIAGSAALGGIATWTGLRALARAGEAAVAELREDALAAALRLDAPVVERAGPGDLVSRVAEDARVVTEAIAMVVPLLVASLVTVAVSAIGLLAVDWRLGLVGLVAVPMYLLSLRWYLTRSGAYYAAERVAFGERAGLLLGGITGAATLRAFGRGPAELDRITAASARARDLGIDVFAMLTRFLGRNNRAELVTLASILGAGFFFVRAGWVSVGAVATAALLFHRLFNPLGALVGLFDSVQSAAASLVRMVGVGQLPARTGSPAPPATPRGLEIVAVGHRYADTGPAVLTDITLRVGRGETVALVGATGAGKSTVANVAAGLVDPSSGIARIDGAGVRDLDPAALRRLIMLVSQEVHVFDGTLAENLAWGREASEERLWTALREVRADGWVAGLPGGLATRVGDGGHRLAAAQAQQIALARVLVADPPFVVLDEATAEAGSALSRDLDAAAARVLRGRGALVVAHRLSQARHADRIVVLDHGAIVEAGDHDQLVAAGGRYAELWAAWSGRPLA
ncbi:ABC transporter ATP-binding protein [Naumannella huperziae]